MDQATREAIARADTSVTLLIAIELRHSEFPGGVIRQINNHIGVTIPIEAGAPMDGGTNQAFIGESMEISSPDLSTDPDQTLTVGISGISGFLYPFMYNASQTAEIIYCTIRPTAYDVITGAVDVVDALHFEVRGVVMNQDVIAITAGSVNSANQAFPLIRYTPASHPGLYT